MKIQSLFLNNRKIWFSILCGILSALLSKFGLETHLTNININIPWSPLLPILAAMAWGWRYGLLAGLTGGVYFPFILWANDGCANPVTSSIFLAYFVLVGYIFHHKKYKFLWLLGAAACFSSFIFLFDGLFFNSLLAHNPPFWEKETINHLPQELLLNFALKDSVNILLLTLFSDVLLRINIVRRVLGLQTLTMLKNNLKIFLATLTVFFLVWLTYTGLAMVFLKEDNVQQDIHGQIALFVFIFSSVIASRIIFYYSETHFKILDKLKESEGKYRTIFENLNDIFYITNLDGTLLEVSPSIQYHFGFTRDKVLGTSVTNLYFDDKSRGPFLNILQQEGSVNDHELEFKTKNNEKIYCSVNARLVFDENGKPKQIEGILRNITERKLSEEKISLSEKRLREAQQIAHLGHWELDLVYNKLYWSDEIYRIFDLKPQEFSATYEAFLDKIHPNDRKKVNEAYTSSLKNKMPYEIEHRLLLNTGELKYVLEKCNTEFDKHGNPIRSIGTVFDITSLKKTEQELMKAKEKAEESENQLKLISDNFVNGMIYQVAMLDENKRKFNYVSEAVTQLYGCTVQEAKENSDLIYSKLHSEDINRLIEKEKEALHNMSVFKTEARVINPDGTTRWSYYISKPRIINETVCWDGIEIDITERKQLELELINAKEKAEESDRLKSAFLANMSHEIRTPMNGILGFSNLLKTPGLSGEKQQKFIGLIEKSGERMLNTIQEIVDISKIESGQMKVYIKETNINEKVEYVYNLLKLDSEQKGLQLSFKNSLPDTKVNIKTDGEKLYGILTNLVKNAIKYTDKGSIEFGYNLKENFFEFYVNDTGIGISKDRQKAIFDRFIQADIADVDARQGAGLGLAISKAFVEMLGGKIWIESEEGKGSAFKFTLPLHKF